MLLLSRMLQTHGAAGPIHQCWMDKGCGGSQQREDLLDSCLPWPCTPVPGPICYSDPQAHKLLPARFHLVQYSLLTFLKVSTTWGCSNKLLRGMPWSMCTGGRKHTPTPLRQLSANHRAVSATVLLLGFQHPTHGGICPSTTMSTHVHAHTHTDTHT